MTHNPIHDEAVWRVQSRFLHMLRADWIVRVQSAITTADSEPEPDIVVAKRLPRGYARSHPRPRDIAMIVEVAESSLAEDRDDQGRIYARARIPVYWILNLIDNQLEVYTLPSRGKEPIYRQHRDFRAHESVLLVIAGEKLGLVRVSELLP